MLVLEVGVELPMFYENEGAYRFLIHLAQHARNFPYGRGGSECMVEHLESSISSVFVYSLKKNLFKPFTMFLHQC